MGGAKLTTDQIIAQAISGLISLLSLGLVGVLKLYVGRLVSRLDEVDKDVRDLKKVRECKWSEHIQSQQTRDIELEKRCTRAELLIEVLYHNTVGMNSKPSDALHIKNLLDGDK
jgi:hypothetical protein